MTNNRPERRITLHFAHIFLTELRTFIIHLSWRLTLSVNNPTLRQIIRGEFNNDVIACQDTDIVLSDPSGYVTKNHVTVRQLHAKHRTG